MQRGMNTHDYAVSVRLRLESLYNIQVHIFSTIRSTKASLSPGECDGTIQCGTAKPGWFPPMRTEGTSADNYIKRGYCDVLKSESQISQ